MKRLILFRHGERTIQTGEASGDGPLTPAGQAVVEVYTESVIRSLRAARVTKIDLAVVSGSIRCAETFAIIWRRFLEQDIKIEEYDMDRKYFATPGEIAAWNYLYRHRGKALRRLIEKIGEKRAVMGFASELVQLCAQRTAVPVQRALDHGAKNILVVTHGPHDALIQEQFTGVECETCLALGTYNIIELDKRK